MCTSTTGMTLLASCVEVAQKLLQLVLTYSPKITVSCTAIELFQNLTIEGEKQSARYAYLEITSFVLSRKRSMVRQWRTVDDVADCYARLSVNGRTIEQHVSHQGPREHSRIQWYYRGPICVGSSLGSVASKKRLPSRTVVARSLVGKMVRWCCGVWSQLAVPKLTRTHLQ